MFDGGPLDGGLSAELIIDNDPQFLCDIVDRFKSVVCIATVELGGKLSVQLVSTKDGLADEFLKRADTLTRISLPLFICGVHDHAPTDAAPKPVG